MLQPDNELNNNVIVFLITSDAEQDGWDQSRFKGSPKLRLPGQIPAVSKTAQGHHRLYLAGNHTEQYPQKIVGSLEADRKWNHSRKECSRGNDVYALRTQHKQRFICQRKIDL